MTDLPDPEIIDSNGQTFVGLADTFDMSRRGEIPALYERFFAARVRGRGISVLSACSHAGVVNACLGAMGMAPGTPVDVVLGGYHLAGRAMETRIADTVRDLAHLVNPRVLAPGHCTGWRAKAALGDVFSPGRYGPSVVGSRYRLEAEEHSPAD